METWSDLCRSCLSSNTKVSFDDDNNVRERFLETTSIEVKSDDGLPQKLCGDCLHIMNTSYEFRKQCVKMDADLKIQLESLQFALLDSKADTLGSETVQPETELSETIVEENTFESHASESQEINLKSGTSDFRLTMNQLEQLVKTEPADSEDDCYYVVVIDNSEDNNETEEQAKIDTEKTQVTEKVIAPPVKIENKLDSFMDQNAQDSFENSSNSFIIPETRVPINVPATILENEEESEDIEENVDTGDTAMEIDMQQQDSNSQNEDQFVTLQLESVQGNYKESSNTSLEIVTSDTNNITSVGDIVGEDGTILKKIGSKIMLKTSDNITYLTDADDPGSQEVILCEGDNTSQYELMNCEGSEFVIEYSDGQVATIFQQEDGTFLCTCGEKFADLEEYEKHEHTHNPSGENLCNLCGKGFESAEILTGHFLLHSVSGMLLSCPFCDQLVKRNSLTQHIKYSHNNIKPKCNVCNKTFANPNNLKRHMMIHSGIKEYQCDICKKRFCQKITMQTHRLTHLSPFACRQCDTDFPNKVKLTEHLESNTCTKSKFNQIKDELIKTVRRDVTSDDGKFLGYGCSICSKMFSVMSALEKHVESTHMEEPNIPELLCQECGEVVPSEEEMMNHVSLHKLCNKKGSAAKRFECTTCGKNCPSQAMLMMHERVHTNERPFSCQLCSLKFKTKTHLRTHQLTHTRERKFGCSVCMKFFALKGNLVVHLRTHTGERPYQCSLCSESFIDSKYLKKHKLKKHAIENVPWNVYYNEAE